MKIIRGSALKALQNDKEFEKPILEIIDILDSTNINWNEREQLTNNHSFLMPIQVVHKITGFLFFGRLLTHNQ